MDGMLSHIMELLLEAKNLFERNQTPLRIRAMRNTVVSPCVISSELKHGPHIIYSSELLECPFMGS